jgi:hypothetical protein
MTSTELSLNATPTGSLTMADAIKGPSLARIAREQGRHIAIRWVSEEVQHAARLCGGGFDAATIADVAEMVMDRFQFRTANALRLALRDGMNAGKLYGKLTYPVIAEWLTNHEDAAEQDSFNSHQGLK